MFVVYFKTYLKISWLDGERVVIFGVEGEVESCCGYFNFVDIL